MQDFLTAIIELTTVATIVYTVALFAAFITTQKTPIFEEAMTLTPADVTALEALPNPLGPEVIPMIKVQFKSINQIIDEAIAQSQPSPADMGLRELRKLGQSRKIKGARAMNKPALLAALV